ncbi:nucleoside phosphorylase domain-containing protein [Aspergillus carlsbadensis]|nr:nucleoside phosphorylase domain-containing protein [Aspergillus carlsbadensis]
MTDGTARPAKRRRAATPPEPDFGNSATATATATTASNARSSFSSWTSSDYTVGWICALPIEMAASRTMFDELHPSLIQDETDTNTYTLGRIGEHNVVLVCLPSGTMGTSPAATAAANMLRTFPKIRFGLMVGVGGGAPGPPSSDPCEDLRLGDVVVSNPDKDCGGVIQYDFGRTVAAGKFVQTGLLNKPPAVLRSGVSTLRALHLTEGPSTYQYVCEMLEAKPNMASKFQYPGQRNDLLFEASYDHFDTESPGCESCDRRHLVPREPRMSPDPVIHYGTIGSANQVMRHGGTRDKLCREKNILCFEMEAAGLMDQFPSLVVRGICDYSDTHKAKQWQPYAAATAAAYAKELLEVMPAAQVNATAEVTRALSMVAMAIDESLEPLKRGGSPTLPARSVKLRAILANNVERRKRSWIGLLLQSTKHSIMTTSVSTKKAQVPGSSNLPSLLPGQRGDNRLYFVLVSPVLGRQFWLLLRSDTF